MTLNIKRLLHQIKLNLHLKWKTYAMLVIIGLVIVVFHYFNKDFTAIDFISSKISNRNFFNTAPNIDVNKFHFNWFPQFLLYLSCAITSLSFSEYSSNTSRTFHLSIPSSILEKWLSKVIIALFLGPLSLVVLYQIFIWISQLWPPVDDYYQVPVHVLDPYLRPHIITAILLQGIFFASCIWYKKWSIVKALLSILVIIMIYNTVMTLSIILLNPGESLAEQITVQSLTSTEDFLRASDKLTAIREFSFLDVFFRDKIMLSIISLLSLGLSFLKFKEMEA